MARGLKTRFRQPGNRNVKGKERVGDVLHDTYQMTKGGETKL